MHTRDHQIKSEYRQGVLNVLHYISQNLSGDVSLETLASIANYSPFHFQKIFSEAVSESPKKYIMRLRMERAAHHLKIFSNVPIFEIGAGCGFSSPSIFSRAFKNYYGISAEEFRESSLDDISIITNEIRNNNKKLVPKDSELWINKIINPMEIVKRIDILPPPSIKTFKPLKIAYLQTTLNYPESISFAFKSLMHWAIPNDIVFPGIKFVGIWLDVPFYTSPDK
jgi:AraC family transcriptional regulator